MIPYRVLAVSDSIADAVRSRRESPSYGHPAHAEVATGCGPCRSCLQTFREGEERRILFTYDAFSGLETLPLPGPVFLHEEVCERYDEDRGFPEGLRFLSLTFNAYGSGRKLMDQVYATGLEIDGLLDRLLALPGLAYVHVRNTEAGCYVATIVPAARGTCGNGGAEAVVVS